MSQDPAPDLGGPGRGRVVLATLVACVLAGVLLAWAGPKDMNWDLLNYHYTNGWAAVTGRTWEHLYPAQLQSLLNPALDILQYLLIEALPPRGVAGVLGGLHGVAFWLLLGLAWHLVGDGTPTTRGLVAGGATLAAASGPLAREGFARTTGDLTLLVPVLAGLLLCLRALEDPRRDRALAATALAGALLGMAAGFKWTLGMCCLAAAVAVLVAPPRAASRPGALLALAAGGVPATLLVAGPWMVLLQRRFGSPVFPFFNGWFASPYGLPVNFRDLRWGWDGVGEALTFPLSLAQLGLHKMEHPSRGLHLPLAWVALGLLAAWWLVRGRTQAAPRLTRCQRWLLAFFLSCYALWAVQFAYYRYLLPVELLAPLVVCVALGRVVRGERRRQVLVAVAVVAMVGSTRYPGVGVGGWGHPSYFAVQFPEFPDAARTMVLLGGKAPTGFAVPFLPTGVRAVRLRGNLRLVAGPALWRQIDEAVAAHRGPLLLLSIPAQIPDAVTRLGELGLELVPDSCRPVPNASPLPLSLCRVRRP